MMHNLIHTHEIHQKYFRKKLGICLKSRFQENYKHEQIFHLNQIIKSRVQLLDNVGLLRLIYETLHINALNMIALEYSNQNLYCSILFYDISYELHIICIKRSLRIDIEISMMSGC